MQAICKNSYMKIYTTDLSRSVFFYSSLAITDLIFI